MRKNIGVSILGLILASCVAVIAACSSDDDTTQTPTTTADAGSDTGAASSSGDSGQAATTGTAVLTINYAGTLRGRLAVAVINDPNGANFKIGGTGEIAGPTSYPQTVTIANIDPGTYDTLLAYIDVDGNADQGPAADDPSNIPGPITITAGQTTTQTLTLMDPDPDAGADAGH